MTKASSRWTSWFPRVLRSNSLALRLFLTATAWAVIILAITGVILSSLVRRLQTYLLRWRPAQQLAG